ncbi:MAG: hypothetical protein WCE94_03230 [Candidatus Methanoperedens sp.]
MKIEELPDELRKAIRSLKNGSLTIEADVMEAIEEAEYLKDLEERVFGTMNNLLAEVKDVIREFKHRQLTEKERDRMIDVYASGPLTYRPKIDDPLFLLGMLQYYESGSPILSVEAKQKESFFYEKNGIVKTEWYGKRKEIEEPETPIEMDEFREMAADVIDEVTEAIQEEYPDLKTKEEFLEESPDAAILYGESYYTLESRIEDQLRNMFILRNPKNDEKTEEPEATS